MAIYLPGRNNTRDVGEALELHACQHLQQSGLQLVCRNYRCKSGEIDLIMTEAGQVLVFVEVRFRRSSSYGDPIATVTHQKQKKCRLAASRFLQSNPHLRHFSCRFDVVGVRPGDHPGAWQCEWIRHAFM